MKSSSLEEESSNNKDKPKVPMRNVDQIEKVYAKGRKKNAGSDRFMFQLPTNSSP
jgi:hypothetical protein